MAAVIGTIELQTNSKDLNLRIHHTAGKFSSMKVECIYEDLKQISVESYFEFWRQDSELSIRIGDQSTVYATLSYNRHTWYLIDAGACLKYYPAELFKIIDERLSKYWIVRDGMDVFNRNWHVLRFGFKEILDNPTLYSAYLEDEPGPFQIVEKYRKLMDEEFED